MRAIGNSAICGFPLSVLLRAIAVLLSLAMGACGSGIHKGERFSVDSPYQHLVSTTPEAACAAVRSALLSQGYLVTEHAPRAVKSTKEFQPDDKTHADLEFSVLCEERSTRTAIYATAIEQRYEAKKTSQAASLTVPKIGAISVPTGSSTDSLVKTGSATVTDRVFYERFFSLVDRMLAPDAPSPR